VNIISKKNVNITIKIIIIIIILYYRGSPSTTDLFFPKHSQHATAYIWVYLHAYSMEQGPSLRAKPVLS